MSVGGEKLPKNMPGMGGVRGWGEGEGEELWCNDGVWSVGVEIGGGDRYWKKVWKIEEMKKLGKKIGVIK